MPELSAALLRMPDQMTGLRPGLREQLEAVSVAEHHVDQVAELRAELAAFEQAEEALDRSRREILAMAGHSTATDEIAVSDALEREGLQKAPDGQ